MSSLFAYDGAKHRIERLAKAQRIALEIMGLSVEQSALLIESLTDYKGSLQVRWYAEPTARQRQAYSAAWELMNENHVQHFIVCDGAERAA